MYDFTFPLPAGEADAALGTYRDAVAERERSAGVASLRHVLTPASVAAIGASRRPGSIGRAILQNIISGNFPGTVCAVNPGVAELDGVRCVPSAAALPGEVDLAVVAAPAAAVPGIAEQCGRRGGQGPGGDHGGPGRRGPRGAATVMDQVEAIRLLPGPGEDAPAVPAYAYPDSAARALGHAARYGTWQATPPGRAPDLDDLRQDRAKDLVTGLLTDAPKGGWLPLDATAELLGCYGVPLAGRIAVTTQDAAVAAAARFAAPSGAQAGCARPGAQERCQRRPARSPWCG